MYEILLVDIDNTIFNFDIAEDKAIHIALKHYNIDPTEDIVKKFKEINESLWRQFELGNITKEKLLEKRFEDLFVFLENKEYVSNNISKDINKYYLTQLASSSDLMPNAYECLKQLAKSHKIYPVTNGVYNTQTKRINNSIVKEFFSRIYISEQIGIQKPHKEFFDYVFNDLKIKDKSKVLLIGDSLTADILGGINYGIDTVWYNYNQKTSSNIKAKYEINDLLELIDICK